MTEIQWEDALVSAFAFLLKCGVVILAYKAARHFTERYRKGAAHSEVRQWVQASVICLISILIISCLVWGDSASQLAGDEDGNDISLPVPPKIAHQNAAQVFFTLLVVGAAGIYRAFKTPKNSQLETVEKPLPHH